MGQWFSENLFNIVGTFVGSGLFCTALSVYLDSKARKHEANARRIGNLLKIATNHRELWEVYLYDKDLWRVRDESADIKNLPITETEKIFVNMVIQHLNSVFYAINNQMMLNVEGMQRDTAEFFSLPIPKTVWEKLKAYQNEDFVKFVESSLIAKYKN